MKGVPYGSVDMILCDLPYGTTACKWDTVIPFEPLWEQYKRLIKPNGAIVLFGSQPFTTALISSNLDMFKYSLIWEKSRPSNFPLAKKQFMKYHEDISVFYRKQPTYNPEMIQGEKNHRTKSTHGKNNIIGDNGGGREWSNTSDMKYPSSVIKVKSTDSTQNLHPTQKPVALCEYLIKTYTNEGETVLDNCMGSGTTGVACVGTNRKFIGIEQDAGYFKIAEERIQKAAVAEKS
jgi:site-specific DNA-methyltransferase (adenine-specific)